MCEQPSSWMAEEKFRLKMKGKEDLEEATFRAVPPGLAPCCWSG